MEERESQETAQRPASFLPADPISFDDCSRYLLVVVVLFICVHKNEDSTVGTVASSLISALMLHYQYTFLLIK